MDYSAGFILSILANREAIESFLESTTAVLTPYQYSLPKDAAEFYQQEGHTFWNTGSRTTNVPSRGSFRDTLIMWVADIDRARKILTSEEDDALLNRAQRKAGRPSTKLQEMSDHALVTVVDYLNYGTLPCAP